MYDKDFVLLNGLISGTTVPQNYLRHLESVTHYSQLFPIGHTSLYYIDIIIIFAVQIQFKYETDPIRQLQIWTCLQFKLLDHFTDPSGSTEIYFTFLSTNTINTLYVRK